MTTDIENPEVRDEASQPETMRHILPLSFVRGKIEECRDVADRILPEGLTPGSSAEALIEERVQALVRVLLQMAEAAGAHRMHPSSGTQRARLDKAFASALQAISRLDPEHFRQRPHYTSFRRSSGELVSAAMFVVVYELQQLVAAILPVDPGVYEKVNEKLVRLEVTFEEAMRSTTDTGSTSA